MKFNAQKSSFGFAVSAENFMYMHGATSAENFMYMHGATHYVLT